MAACRHRARPPIEAPGMCMRMCTCAHAHMCACACACGAPCMCMCMCAHVHALHMHARVHMHMHRCATQSSASLLIWISTSLIRVTASLIWQVRDPIERFASAYASKCARCVCTCAYEGASNPLFGWEMDGGVHVCVNVCAKCTKCT